VAHAGERTTFNFVNLLIIGQFVGSCWIFEFGYTSLGGNRGQAMTSQQFGAGEWVRTDSGEVGKVVYTARLTVFVQLEGDPADATVKAFLESQLTRIEPPDLGAGRESLPSSQ
jgi:hypothetical protein